MKPYISQQNKLGMSPDISGISRSCTYIPREEMEGKGADAGQERGGPGETGSGAADEPQREAGPVGEGWGGGGVA